MQLYKLNFVLFNSISQSIDKSVDQSIIYSTGF